MTKIFCFDIDGTLSNNNHRNHLLKGEKRDWDSFFALQHLDAPYEAVFEVLKALQRCGEIYGDIGCIIVTGREEQYRKTCLDWLEKHGVSFPSYNLFMRPNGFRGNDDDMKVEILNKLLKENPDWQIVGIFDDRRRIVDKYRQNNFYCFDCNQTREDF